VPLSDGIVVRRIEQRMFVSGKLGSKQRFRRRGGVEQQGHGARASLLYSEEGRGTGSGTLWKGSGGGTDGRDGTTGY
jgi:hypothetical protein